MQCKGPETHLPSPRPQSRTALAEKVGLTLRTCPSEEPSQPHQWLTVLLKTLPARLQATRRNPKEYVSLRVEGPSELSQRAGERVSPDPVAHLGPLGPLGSL